jgi:hypothetical protein
MPEMTERIRQHLADPEALEAIYRQEPEAFMQSLPEAAKEAPDSLVLRAWQARLSDDRTRSRPRLGAAWRSKLTYAIAIALAVGIVVRVPAIWLGDEWYYPRYAPSLVMLALACYFWMEHRRRGPLIAGLVLAVVSFAYAGALPGGDPDSVVMALIHMPIVFWAFLGVVFAGEGWRETEARVRFVRYNGELVALASLVALGGMVFSGVTMALFSLLADNVEQWYVQNVGVLGAAAVPIAGTYLYDAVFDRGTGIAMVLARVFAPLFLVMTVTYLAVAFFTGQNVFVDRSVLITFNGLLLVVLGITVFSIVGRGKASPVGAVDYINLALVIVTLVMDAIALSAIVFRLASFGFTPNRVVVLGANLVIMTHLAWMCWNYVAVCRKKAEFGVMQRAVAGYLPAYGAWAFVVAFVLPVVFGFA